MASLTYNFINFTTYNLHGFNQGATQLRDLCSTSDSNHIIAVQEHWLAKHDLDKLYNVHDSFQCIAKSTMTNKHESGILVGRPFGGLAILIKKSLHVKINFIDVYITNSQSYSACSNCSVYEWF